MNYGSILKDLQKLTIYIKNPALKNLLNTFIKTVLKSGEYDALKQSFTIDVEDAILSLEDHFKKKSKRPVEFYFTVGMNQGFSSPFSTDSRIKTDSGTSLSSLSYAGEKIGFKFKIANWGYRNAFQPGDYRKGFWGHVKTIDKKGPEPLIEDLHLLFYGSGILYNLANLKTSKSFNNTIIGAGLGLTFFNNLNTSICWAYPVKNNSRENTFGYINFAVDVSIFDYIKALNNKRKVDNYTKEVLARKK